MSARVLVVDDILPNVKLLEAKLLSEYYDVVTATSGQEALDKLDEAKPDIILLDVMMPGMDGFEVCHRIKHDDRYAHIPVVMVTALTDKEDLVRGLEAGADDFLSKPINDTALMSRVRSLVRLKMAMDEWRNRENTASQLGVVGEAANVMNQPVENAKILVIEDKEFERKKIEQTLFQDLDIVIGVESGVKAMELIGIHNFDVIIISINLAQEDGLRLTSHMRSNDRTRSVPIVLLGESDDVDKIASGLELGAHDYLMRPVDRNELLARVRTQVRRRRFQEKLKSTYEISLSMALTDSLTGLYNRRYLETHLEKLLENSNNTNKSLGVLLMDIDHFKSVNDTHGHGVGDEVLKVFAERIKDSLRSFDLVARIGGEEFVVILPDIPDERAYIVAERLRRSIADEPIPCSTPDGTLSVTTSLGGVMIRPGSYSIQEVLDRADKCLYQAKETGRNMCIFEEKGKLDPEEYKGAQRPIIE